MSKNYWFNKYFNFNFVKSMYEKQGQYEYKNIAPIFSRLQSIIYNSVIVTIQYCNDYIIKIIIIIETVPSIEDFDNKRIIDFNDKC